MKADFLNLLFIIQSSGGLKWQWASRATSYLATPAGGLYATIRGQQGCYHPSLPSYNLLYILGIRFLWILLLTYPLVRGYAFILVHLGSFYQDGLFHTAVNLGGILFQLLNIFSPSPAMNAEAEKTNQVLQQYLRCYCTYSQDNWPSLISLAEFSYDNFLHTLIDSLSSFLIQGFHQRTQGNRSWGLSARATGFPTPLETAAWTGETVTREDCGPPIPEGDKVMLSTKFLVSTRPLRR